MQRITQIICKTVQKQTLDCLSRRHGLLMCFAALFLVLISALQFGEVALEWSMAKYAATFNVYHDNIAGTSFQDRLCLPVPIDVVYTWVNGSDPQLIQQLRKLKQELDEDRNRTEHTDSTRPTTANTNNPLNAGKERSDSGCPFEDCVPADLVLIKELLPEQLGLPGLQTIDDVFRSASRLFHITSGGSVTETVTAVKFKDSVPKGLFEERLVYKNQNLTLTEGFLTSDSSRPSAVKMKKIILVPELPSNSNENEFQTLIKSRVSQAVKIKVHKNKHVAVLNFQEEKEAQRVGSLRKGNLSFQGVPLKFQHGMLIWRPFSVKVLSAVKKSKEQEDQEAAISTSRFADNEEMKYSLRSVERYAPWVRNIYIVTNGQIPSWLNLDNPRVKVISHEEIFLNKSHLPTFSSPSIESHLHRIPGLSKKFIYLNDDVMFGDDVWPDDFYSHSKGQKVFLTWPVPNCNEGCPTSWINDKYCDKACNNSECDWDGGDCLGVSSKARWQYHGWQNQLSAKRTEFCSTGCADTWIGDKYCDASCNVLNCGFDAGDCGIGNFHLLHGIPVLPDTKHVTIPDGFNVVYFNLSSVFGSGKITEAQRSESPILRTAAVAQKFKLLTLTFRPNFTESEVLLQITGLVGVNQSEIIRVSLNVSVNTMTSANQKKPSLAMPTAPVQNKTVKNVTVQPQTSGPVVLYPVRIQDASRPLNYWTTGNESYGLPTWKPSSEGDVGRYPNLNVSLLPHDIQVFLRILKYELEDGDITHKGYYRKRNSILATFFSSNRSQPDQSPGKQQPNSKDEDGVEGRAGRKLLSLNEANSFDEMSLRSGQILNDHLLLEESDWFVADWIADTKRKQLTVQGGYVKGVDASHEGLNLEQYFKATSFLPWERLGVFDDIVAEQLKEQQKELYEVNDFHQRTLKDTFADSLLHVNRIFNKEFGYKARKVPAHMPHMVDVDIMNELQTLFPEHFAETSSHKLRSPKDMQFAFSYFYYLIGKQKEMNLENIFQDLDTDKSGTLSDRELRTLAAKIFPLPLDLKTIKKFESQLINCSLDSNTTDPAQNTSHVEDYFDPNLPLVTLPLIKDCKPVLELLNNTYKAQDKYKYEIVGEEDIIFKMIRDNASSVVPQLDNIRKTRKKFICLNDNIDHSKKDAKLIRALLVDFYESLFPIPSQFELPRQFRNRFLHIDELNAWLREKQLYRFYINVIVGIVLSCVLFSCCPDSFYRFLKQLLPSWKRRTPAAPTNKPNQYNV